MYLYGFGYDISSNCLLILIGLLDEYKEDDDESKDNECKVDY